jgi:pyruvoyl-dependent arginine decarboxylase (PvlArgDC)
LILLAAQGQISIGVFEKGKYEMTNSDNETTDLKMWAASIVATRANEDGFQLGNFAELIKATSEEEAIQIGLEMAREQFSEEGWENHSVALNRIIFDPENIDPKDRILASVQIQLRT